MTATVTNIDATKTVTLKIASWTDSPICPKCIATDVDEVERAFFYARLQDLDILQIACKVCGYNWLMESADAE